MKISAFDITTAPWGDVKKAGRYHMAILPWGATEPHNGHLPYCTDMLSAQAIAFEVAAGAKENGVNVMVLPGVPFGSQNPGQNDLPFCIHTSQATQAAILHDIVRSLDHQGIKRLLIINGHGGNSFKGFIRDLAVEMPDFLVASSEWFSFIPGKDYFDAAVDDPGQKHFLKRVESRYGRHTIEAANALGYGTVEYELIDVD